MIAVTIISSINVTPAVRRKRAGPRETNIRFLVGPVIGYHLVSRQFAKQDMPVIMPSGMTHSTTDR
jgi:hypothetical protein